MCEIRSISSLPLSKGNIGEIFVLSEIGSSIDTLYLIIDLLVHHGFRTVSDILELKPTELSQGIFTRHCISYNFLFIARA